MSHDILLTVDYHDEICVIRRRDRQTDEVEHMTIPTAPGPILRVVTQACDQAQARGGQVVWIQESTTGWARVQELIVSQAKFALANVLQMPLPPKARRRKTDKIDTARLEREYLNGELPLAHQPPAWWRQVRRLVALRENLTNRRTALRNGINRYLAHETWHSRMGLWSAKGRRRLQNAELPPLDRQWLNWKLAELDELEPRLQAVMAQIEEVFQGWPDAQRVDAIKGIGPISAVSIVARIGPISRFRNAEHLIAFAGLAPGVRQSDQTRRDGHIGGGGTDRHLRHYLIEASVWARKLPRYAKTYERMRRRRGPKIGRLLVARMLLRSIYKMLRDQMAFEAESRHPETAQRKTKKRASRPKALATP
jgi:transposase